MFEIYRNSRLRSSMEKSLMRQGYAVLSTAVLVIVGLLILSLGAVLVRAATQLSVGFYNGTCPGAEKIVRDTMTANFQTDPKIAAHLLRIQFHDCAATGCDASLLLTGSQSEQNAAPNLNLGGFSIIDDMKAKLEAQCPGTVSCSDIIAMAARDAVALTGGPSFAVPLGRFDSTFSGGLNVSLPSSSGSVPAAITFFNGMGLSTRDMVVLLGAHTIGAAHCNSFNDRLYNFNNTGSADPSVDPPFLAMLQGSCPLTPTGLTASTTTVALDLDSEFVFDNHFYLDLIKMHGVLRLDQELFTHRPTSHLVFLMAANKTLFFENFVVSLIKLGQIGVRDSNSGRIRTQCFA